MSNLVANEMYGPGGHGAHGALRGAERLLSRCRHLTIVTNEVFSGGAQYAGGTLSYLRGLAQVNRVLAARADAVAEIVCSRVNPLKGGDLLCL